MNCKSSAKDSLNVTALIAIMKPETKSQASRLNKQSLRSHHSNKTNSWTLNLMETSTLYPKDKTNPFFI